MCLKVILISPAEDESKYGEDIDDEENEVAGGSEEGGDKSNKSGSEDEVSLLCETALCEFTVL